LRECGFEVTTAPHARPQPGDVLVIWNRYGHYEAVANAYERAGATVLVAENGYVGSDEEGRQLYAISRSQHNGAGTWEVESGDRWSRLNIELKPWRSGGSFILVLPQRGIGSREIAMPAAWLAGVVSRLGQQTKRAVRIRQHPGKLPHPPLEPDLADCFAAVTWGSGAAIKAIIAGVPVFHEFSRWIGAPAAKFGAANLEQPFVGDRLPMLRRLAYAQWSVAEIERGEPFALLLGAT
jgi:hypothetical protein